MKGYDDGLVMVARSLGNANGETAKARTGPVRDFAEEYAEALEEYIEGGGEAALRRGYEIGRAAMASGMGLVEMMSLHHPALANNLSRAPWPEEMASRVALAAEFFLESVSPYEMTHRGYREAVAALHHLNETLEGKSIRSFTPSTMRRDNS